MNQGERATAGKLEAGREAAERGEWQKAYELLTQADVAQPLDTVHLPLLADVAYAAGHLGITIEVWERVYATAIRAGDRIQAATAATRIALHLLFDTALMAPIRAWTKRGEQLLEGQPDTPVHAWLGVVHAYERLLSGDAEQAQQWAKRAIDIGAQHDAAAAAVGRVAHARTLILNGDISEGLEQLNDAAVSGVSGELDPLTTGVVYCEVVCALQALAQFDTAEQWTQAMEQWCHGHAIGSIHGRCRVHRAEILRLRGASEEAELEVLRACDELRPYLRREFGWPLTELGRIRLITGDIEGAEEALRAAHEAGWNAQPGLALVHLARGDVVAAAASIRDALEHPVSVPSKELPPNTELQRAPLLDAQVEIAVASGDLERARWAAAQLENVAETFGGKALQANAALARARVLLAERAAADARTAFERAIRLWSEAGAPYETAHARLGLGLAHRQLDNEAGAQLELQSARATFERIGAAAHARRAAQLCTESKASATAVDVVSDRNVFHHGGDFWSVTFAGRTDLLRDAKGLHYLAALLAKPGREVHVLDMVVGEYGTSNELVRDAVAGDTGEVLDARAKAAYRRRLAEIDEDIEEARMQQDVEREAQASAERDILLRELSRAFGLGGRERRAGSAAERARVSVTRAVRAALTRIREVNPSLAAHLDSCIRTGTFCSYRPDPRLPVEWQL